MGKDAWLLVVIRLSCPKFLRTGMSTEELKQVVDQKWQAFYRASSAAGIWLIAFMAALGWPPSVSL